MRSNLKFKLFFIIALNPDYFHIYFSFYVTLFSSSKFLINGTFSSVSFFFTVQLMFFIHVAAQYFLLSYFSLKIILINYPLCFVSFIFVLLFTLLSYVTFRFIFQNLDVEIIIIISIIIITIGYYNSTTKQKSLITSPIYLSH